MNKNLKKYNEPSPALYNRLIAAYDFVKDKPDIKIIVYGGQGNGNITEAEVMKRFLVERGINPSHIIKEEHSSSIFENLKYAKSKILFSCDKIAARRPLKVKITEYFHMFLEKLAMRF